MKTYGCTHNRADSERMAGLLTEAGYTITHTQEQADAILLNSCTVKSPAVQRFLNDIKNATQRVIIAGCVPQAEPTLFKELPTIGVKNIHRVVEVVDNAFDGRVVRFLDHKEHPSLSLPRVKSNKLIEIIPINSGCLGKCTFCKTVQARGRLRSYEKSAILTAINTAVAAGAKEIWLTSEDVAVYGRDIGETLIKLLQEITLLPGEFMVRIGMGNPPHFGPMITELIQLLKAHPDRFFRFLHLPVQSGSNSVLESMQREYNVEEFKSIITKLRKTPITFASAL